VFGRRWRSFSTTAFSLALVSSLKHNQEMIKMLENKWITTKEAAELIGCTRAHVSYLADKGQLVAERVNPRCWLIEKKSAQEIAKIPAKTGRPRKNSNFDSE